MLAIAISISPSFVKVPLGENVSFTVEAFGEGKVETIKAIGPYLSWYEKSTWLPPSGKKLSLTFFALKEGSYTIKVKLGEKEARATVEVYKPSRPEELWEEIQKLKKIAKGEELRKVLEAEKLYNESKYELARLKLEEVKISGGRARAVANYIPLILVALVLLFVLFLASKLLLH